MKLAKHTLCAAIVLATTSVAYVANAGVGVGVGVGPYVEGFTNVIASTAPNTLPDGVTAPQGMVKDYFGEQGVQALIKANGKWGIIGTDGKVIVEPTYKKITPSYSGTLTVTEGKKRIRLTARGEALTQEQLEALANDLVNSLPPAQYPSDKYTSYKEKKLYGFKDTDGQVVLAPQFKAIITEFSEDCAFVRNKEGTIVAIDGTGKELFKAPSSVIFPYENGLAEYQRTASNFGVGLGAIIGSVVGGVWGGGGHGGIGVGGYSHDYWDNGGRGWTVGFFTEDHIKRGYINRNGDIIVDSKNDAVYPMTMYGTIVRDKDKVGFVNRTGKYIIQPGDYEVGTIDLDQAFLSLKNKDTKKYGVFSIESGEQVRPFTYDGITFSPRKRMIVKLADNSEWLLDTNTFLSVYKSKPKADIMPFLDDNYTWVKEDGTDHKDTYVIINIDGQVEYTDVHHIIQKVRPFKRGIAAVKASGKWGLMRYDGTWVAEPVYDEIEQL